MPPQGHHHGIDGSGPRAPGHPGMLFVALAVALVTTQFVVTSQALPAGQDQPVATAVTVDLVVGLPLLGYLLLTRRAGWSHLVVGPLLLAGLVLANLLVPVEDAVVLDVAGYVAGAVELAILLALGLKARTLRRTYREQRPAHVYGFDALRGTLATVVPGRRAPDAVATELAIVGLGVLGWRRSYTPPERAHAFGSLRRSGYTAVFGAIVAAAAIEAVAVHLLVSQWSHTAAWVVTTLTLYSVVWLAGDYHGLRLAPHVVRDGRLHLRVGMRMAADVPLDLLAQARRWTSGTTADETFVPFGAPTVEIELRGPVEVRRLFGRRSAARTIGVAVDDVAGFLDRVRPEGDPTAQAPWSVETSGSGGADHPSHHHPREA